MDREKIKQRVLQYIHEHPNAADTIDGIVQWWVGGEFSDAEVEEVVRELVDEKMLAEKVVGKRRVYARTGKKRI